MWRFFAGVAASFLLLTGAFLIWHSHAQQGPTLPDAPPARAASASLFAPETRLQAPEASPKSREERRFSRYDKNKDGKVQAAEYLAARGRRDPAQDPRAAPPRARRRRRARAPRDRRAPAAGRVRADGQRTAASRRPRRARRVRRALSASD